MEPHFAWEPPGSTAIPYLLLVKPHIHVESGGTGKDSDPRWKSKEAKILTWEFVGLLCLTNKALSS